MENRSRLPMSPTLQDIELYALVVRDAREKIEKRDSFRSVLGEFKLLVKQFRL